MLSAKEANVLAKLAQNEQDIESAKRERAHKEYMEGYKERLEKRLSVTLKGIEENIKKAILNKENRVLYSCEDSDEYALCQAMVVAKAVESNGYTTEITSHTPVREETTEEQPTYYWVRISWDKQ
jgi:membrane peptidoglycan carboxypeptidase